MRVGLDLDGVCYDFGGSLITHLVRNKGFDPARLTPSMRWDFYLDWGMTLEQFIEECNAGADAGIIFGEGEAFPGTREAVQTIIDAGHTVHVVTDRSFGAAGASELNTARWLARELPKVHSVTFSPDKRVVRVDTMIDDKIQNYDDLVSVGCDAYLLNRPWNVVDGGDARQRVDSLQEFADIVVSKQLVTTA